MLLDVLGRIYVSFEGINAQLSVASENFYALKEQLDTITFLEGYSFKCCCRAQ